MKLKKVSTLSKSFITDHIVILQDMVFSHFIETGSGVLKVQILNKKKEIASNDTIPFWNLKFEKLLSGKYNNTTRR